MKSEFILAKIVRPHGVKGVVKAQTFTSSPERFKKFKSMKIDGTEYEVESVSIDGDFALLKFKGVDDMDAAEALRGKDVSVSRNLLPKPQDGSYYIEDLVGCDVLVDGEKLGVLVAINQYGSADVYEVKVSSGNVCFSAIKDVFKSIDVEKGEINLDGYWFNRVSVYNQR